MSKQCLCYRPADNSPYLEDWTTFLMDRAEVDDPEKLDPAIQQILPYVTIFRKVTKHVDGVELESLELLSYRRGGKTTEQRLAAKRSVGFGGHIDALPGDSILQHIFEETSRELTEELHFKVNAKRLHATIVACARNLNFIAVKNRAPVDAVHTALCLLLDFSEHPGNDNLVLEAGHVEDLRWINVEDTGDEELQATYETWSELVVQGLRHNLLQFRAAKAEHEEMQALQEERERQATLVREINARAAEVGDGTLVLEMPAPRNGESIAWDYDEKLLRLEILANGLDTRVHPIGDFGVVQLNIARGELATTYILQIVPESQDAPEKKRLVLATIRTEVIEPASQEGDSTGAPSETQAQLADVVTGAAG